MNISETISHFDTQLKKEFYIYYFKIGNNKSNNQLVLILSVRQSRNISEKKWIADDETIIEKWYITKMNKKSKQSREIVSEREGNIFAFSYVCNLPRRKYDSLLRCCLYRYIDRCLCVPAYDALYNGILFGKASYSERFDAHLNEMESL